MIIADLTTGNAALQSDRIRPLAITSMERSPKYPNMADASIELGVTGYEVNTWIAFFAPAGVPKDVAARIEEAIKEAVGTPELRPVSRRPADGGAQRCRRRVRKLLAVDVAKWAKLVKEKNIKLAP